MPFAPGLASVGFSGARDSDESRQTLITELGHRTPAAQAVTRRLVRQWQDDLYTGIVGMQRIGEISGDLDAERTAASIIAAIQGGVAILMSTGSSTHLESALDTSLLFLRTGTK